MIEAWISIAPGAFCTKDLSQDRDIQVFLETRLEQCVDAGILDRHGERRGWYIPRQLELEEMDFVNADDTPLDIWFPFDIDRKVELYENSIVIVAGTWNAGKTAVLLNIIAQNRYKWEIKYFNSEMSAAELRKRLSKFEQEGISIDQWNFKAYRRAGRFADVIFPGPGCLNIIDFLECHTDFYEMGKKIKEIHDRLQGGIAIIAVQKNRGLENDMGLGGNRMMEVARLVISLDPGRVKITKAKNFADPLSNPNGEMRDFKLFNGYKITHKQPWYREKTE